MKDPKRARELVDYAKAELAKVLKSGKLEKTDEDGRTPLMSFASDSSWCYDKSIEPENVEMVRALLDAGAKLEARDRLGWTPLYCAVRDAGSPAVIEYLLSRGANPNVADTKFKYSILHMAVDRGKPAIVRTLIEAGADLKAKDWDNRTPLQLAKRAEIKKILELAASGKLKASTPTPVAEKRPAVPPELARFYKEKAKKLAGSSVSGIPGFDPKSPVALRFRASASLAPFDDLDVSPDDFRSCYPLATIIDGSDLLVVDVAKKGLPVFFLSHEDAKLSPVAPTLGKFIAKLAPADKKRKK